MQKKKKLYFSNFIEKIILIKEACENMLNIGHIARLCKWIIVILIFHNMKQKQCRKSITGWLIKNKKNQDTYSVFLTRNVSLPNFAMTSINLKCFLMEVYISFCVCWPAVFCSILRPPPHQIFTHQNVSRSLFPCLVLRTTIPSFCAKPSSCVIENYLHGTGYLMDTVMPFDCTNNFPLSRMSSAKSHLVPKDLSKLI